MLTVIAILVVSALIVCIMAGVGKAPLWVAVLLLCVVEALRILPLGR
jgi:hypothetical protein